MKIAKIKSEKSVFTANDSYLGIQDYGEGNTFPQKVMQIVSASGTGTACLDIYTKFICGLGLADPFLRDMQVNIHRQTLDGVIGEAGKDLAWFNGFALHVNYNANGDIRSVSHVPFEHCRFEAVNRESKHVRKIAVHPDWAHQYSGVLPFQKDDIVFFDIYDPRPEVVFRQVEQAGGWDAYRGQILYYSGDGPLVYPAPRYMAVLTDMRTEQAVSNILARNACSGFLTGGMLIEYLTREQDDEQLSSLQKQMMEFQGDEKVGKILCAQVSTKDEKPEFVPFSGQNYDKEFTSTIGIVQENIGRAFEQPPILRAKDVGANFGADLVKNAYHFYNAITENERAVLSDIFTQIFRHWWIELADDISFRIQPLVFGTGNTVYERLGKENADKVVSLVTDAAIPDTAKRNILSTVYGLSEDDIHSLLAK